MQPRRGHPRVLVIDDTPENREVVADLLLDFGITAVESCDDTLARQMVQSFQPDVVIVDMAMPGEDGTQIAAWIKKQYPGTRVVIYTAFSKASNLKLAIDAVGADAFLQKPFDATDLYKAVVGE